MFIETSIDSAQSRGVKEEDIAAGLCYSIVRNYLHKVVGNKPVGRHILLQGGVAYNPGIVAAFQNACGERLQVSPFFPISGAFGAALLAIESMGGKRSSFAGFDFSGDIRHMAAGNEEIRRNMDFYRQTSENFYRNYDGKRNPNKKTVGIPYVLMIHKFFPMANAFFKALGYNVILSDPSNEETIRLAQETARGETCYPVKLIYGHMMQLIDQKVDYIFLPHMHTLRHEKSKVAYNYGCIYMQSAALSIAKSLELEKKGITLLNPVFDLDFGKEAMGNAMLSVGKQLGKPKPLCAAALLAGARAVRKYDQEAERLGRELLSDVKPGEPVLVMITRGYGITDPVLNMGIPELLLQRGYKVINLEHLPGHSLDLSEDYANMYWPFGQHILTGAKLIASHPNLYAVYLTNHGCGPDSMLSYMFREEMGDKPYLQIEVDEHFSKVGVITRIEAFLHALKNRKGEAQKTDPSDILFRGERIAYQGSFLEEKKEDTLYIPDFGLYTNAILRYVRESYEINVVPLPPLSSGDFLTGRAETTAKEYLPFPALLGSILTHVRTLSDEDRKHAIYLIPSTEGAEADGQYARAIRSVLDHKGYTEAGIFAPVLEKLPVILRSPEKLFHALLEADLLYLRRPETRKKRVLAVVGTPMTQTSLCENVLDKLEQEGERILRAPLTEYLLFLWQEERKMRSGCEDFLKECTAVLAETGVAIRSLQAFSKDMENLHQIADRYLGEVTGANIRYRYAKAVELGESADAVLCIAPRYENAAMVMEMRNIQRAVKTPVYQMYLDGDWDEAAWERLRSFLYYCQ
ncbi:MAG: hypothetical protein IJW67_13250 [Blautia sp.]|nr:hypothetical protein [Blautia sp.]